MYEKIGGIGFWGGALFLLIDMCTPFPTPARGAYAMWWLLVIGTAGAGWLFSRRLPVEETLALAEEHGGELTIPVVSRELGLPVGMATRTLEATCECAEAEVVETGRSRTWFFFNTNRGNNRLVRVIELAREPDARITPHELVTRNIARDLTEAEGMLTRLVARGYLADRRE